MSPDDCPPFRYHDRDPVTGVCGNCGRTVDSIAPATVPDVPAAVNRLRARIIAAAVAIVVAVLGSLTVAIDSACAAEPDLTNGRVYLAVGKPTALGPRAPMRRIYPAGKSPRYVTLRATRASLPRLWEAWELDTVRAFAQKRSWRTAVGRGFDITPNVTGKEWRVDRRILTAVNATARRGLQRCNIISGWRDSSLQAKLWQLFLSGLGNPANRPGTSRHEALYRMPAGAADTYCGGVSFWTWAERRGVASFARSRGLRKPYAHEPWHVEYAVAVR